MQAVRALILFGFTLVTTVSHAGVGVDSSGGGNLAVAAFTSRAFEILKSTPFTPEHRRLLENALNSTQIVPVHTLVDAETNEPIKNQDLLLFWGSPGRIQIKHAAFIALINRQQPVNHHIVHELFRASGAMNNNLSIDDAYQISIGQYRLDQAKALNDSELLGNLAQSTSKLFNMIKDPVVETRNGEWLRSTASFVEENLDTHKKTLSEMITTVRQLKNLHLVADLQMQISELTRLVPNGQRDPFGVRPMVAVKPSEARTYREQMRKGLDRLLQSISNKGTSCAETLTN